jgi:hypothetical protein
MRLRREIGIAAPSATTSASTPSTSARRPARSWDALVEAASTVTA